MSWINDAGKIKVGKKGNLYIQFDKDFEVQKGDTMLIEKFEDHLGKLVDKGIISEDQADQRKEKQHFVKYVLAKPPRD